MKYLLIILMIAVAGTGYMFKENITSAISGRDQYNNKKKKIKDNEKGSAASEVEIKKEWELPSILKEISGISYIDKDRFACIQDEQGTIYIYNVSDEKIEKEIPFAGSGDYEDIALVGNNAYVVRSDGAIFEITDWNIKPVLKQYKTGLTADHNVEGLVYDQQLNRLLIAIKDNEPSTSEYKGVYAFDLEKKSFIAEPVYKIIIEGGKKKGFKPSAISRHPISNDLLIIDGPSSKLLTLEEDGKIKQVYSLGKSFEQPEGITFSPTGDMFISNEGVKKSANIMQVEIN